MNPVNAKYLLAEIKRDKLRGVEIDFIKSVEKLIISGTFLSVRQGEWLQGIYRKHQGGLRQERQYLG